MKLWDIFYEVLSCYVTFWVVYLLNHIHMILLQTHDIYTGSHSYDIHYKSDPYGTHIGSFYMEFIHHICVVFIMNQISVVFILNHILYGFQISYFFN